jgi:hypothetical protein
LAYDDPQSYSQSTNKVQSSDRARYSEKAWDMICLIRSRGLVVRADMFCCYRVMSLVGMTRRQYQDDKRP